MTALRATLLFASAAVLCGAIDYNPQILTLTFAGGRTERLAAESPDACQLAIEAIWSGRWRPVGEFPVNARCSPGNLFPAYRIGGVR